MKDDPTERRLKKDHYSYIRLTRLANGEVQPSVDVYDKDPYQAQSICQEIFDDLCNQYPSSPEPPKRRR